MTFGGTKAKDREFWKDNIKNLSQHVVMSKGEGWEQDRVGAGAVPIRTSKGWLLFYHWVTMVPSKTYCAGIALLDLEDPQKVIARTPEPFFIPEFDWEIKGDVDNVVFPEGAVVVEDEVLVFYGAADSRIGLLRISLGEVWGIFSL